MLSRAVLLLKTGNVQTPLSAGLFFKRSAVSSSKIVAIDDFPNCPVIPKDGPERDLVNFPRPVMAIESGKVRMAFVPDEWFQFFYKKTGVTGPYLFGGGLITYLFSKEFYVIEHEFYNGIILAIFLFIANKKFGPTLAAYLDKSIEESDSQMIGAQNQSIQVFKTGIVQEKDSQQHALNQKILFNAKRENVLLQLEAEYRRRSMQVYSAFKRRLDYQVHLLESKKAVEQKHMVNWIVTNVMKSISPQQEADALKKCIIDLKQLAANAH